MCRRGWPVEAGIAQTWHKLVGDTGEIISIEHYGESADDKTLFREFGFTAEAVAAAAERTSTTGMTEKGEIMSSEPESRSTVRRRRVRLARRPVPRAACRPATLPS